MFVSFPALFYYDYNEYAPSYFVYFPDFGGSGTQGEDIPDTMYMASDWLGIMVADYIENDRKLPVPSQINKLSLKEDAPFQDDKDFHFPFDSEKSFISMVNVDITDYLHDSEPVKKTLTIPKWADKLGKEMQINFSKTLTEAIASKKINM